MKTKTYTPIPADEAAEHVAIGVHTGLRKGSEAPSSGPLWQAIGASTDSAWMDAAKFFVIAMESMGYVICKVEEVEADASWAAVAETLGLPEIPANEDGTTNWPAFAQQMLDIKNTPKS